jgi:subtilisin family serine protease
MVAFATVFTAAIPVFGQESRFTASTDGISLESVIDGNVVKNGSVVRVVVQLQEPGLASYEGGIAGIPATSPKVTKKELNPNSAAAKKYLDHTKGRRNAAKDAIKKVAPNARFGQEFQVAFTGITVTVTVEEANRIARLPGVAAVVPDRLEKPLTDASPAFIDAPAVWSQLGGQANAGEGVVVGVLDTGIWPEHPSFSDPSPVGGAYPAPPVTPGANGFVGGTPRSTCDFGNTAYNPADAPFECNNKLIGAYTFLDTYKALQGLTRNEFDSARDSNGHGTHTASTAAGNAGVAASILGADLGTVSGIAPRAHIIAYRVCGLEGCYSSDSAMAVEQAILDGVDVINFSISGGSNPYGDAVSLAFLGAYDAGILVSASAGNDGPGPDTVNHREPWTLTVGASTTNRQFMNSLTVTDESGQTLTLQGASVTGGVAEPTALVIAPDDDADPGTCNLPAAPGTYTGQIVICERGTTARVEKGWNVLQGGAAGMVLVNPALQGLATDNHFLPTIHLEVDAWQQLQAFLDTATGQVTATISDSSGAEAQGDVMAAFSSRGGTGQALGISKPDVTAPGVQILAGHTPMPEDQTGGPAGEYFQAIQGTSMSAPHAAGAAALLKAAHPDWTPGQIKSALMTTAVVSGVTKEDGTTPASPFDMGSGRIDLAKAVNPGFTFDESAVNYWELADRLWDANYPSLYVPQFPGKITVTRTVTSRLSSAGNWDVTVDAPSDLEVIVPKKLTLPPGQSRSFDITLDGRDIPVGAVRHARITFTRGSEKLTFPITVVRSSPNSAVTAACDPAEYTSKQTTTCTVTIENQSFDDAVFDARITVPSGMLDKVISGGQKQGQDIVFSGTLKGAEAPSPAVVDGTGTSPAGYLPLSTFGITPISGIGDESAVNFTLGTPFVYGGVSYNRIGVVSNGYAVVGGTNGSADIQFFNQMFPDPARPNNVLAPFWTDLNPACGGALRAATLTDGVNSWLVLEWDKVVNYGDREPNSFQIWIGLNGYQDITYTYGPVTEGDGGYLTVGAENEYGNRGSTWYFDGVGNPVGAGNELRVEAAAGAPGETHTITFTLKGNKTGNHSGYAYVTSDVFAGTSVTRFDFKVTK